MRLGDLELPAAARLRLHRVRPMDVQKLELVDLASAPKGTSGALVRLQLDAKSSSFSFLEACMRFYPDGAEDDRPIFLSSGAEDYFLSSSYFDEGMFKTSQAGLTYFNRTTSTLAAYKTHIEDPILWTDGMRLRFRNCEATAGCGDMNHCPNQFCNATERSKQSKPSKQVPNSRESDLNTDVVEYSSLVFTYEWPKVAPNGSEKTQAALRTIQELVSKGFLTEDMEDMATDRVLDGDDAILNLLSAFSDLSNASARVARQLSRRIGKKGLQV